MNLMKRLQTVEENAKKKIGCRMIVFYRDGTVRKIRSYNGLDLALHEPELIHHFEPDEDNGIESWALLANSFLWGSALRAGCVLPEWNDTISPYMGREGTP